MGAVKRFLEQYPGEIDMVEWVLFDDKFMIVLIHGLVKW